MPIDQPEHRFQAFADRFIDRVVLAPFFTSGTDQASVTTENARARAAGRGIKFGLPDHYVLQGEPVQTLWLEFKARGGAASDRQIAVMASIERCGVKTAICRSIYDVLRSLRAGGFRLHGNADNIATEITERWQAAQMARDIKRPKATARPARERPRSSAQLTKIARLRKELMF